jgi:hypothetical protein
VRALLLALPGCTRLLLQRWLSRRFESSFGDLTQAVCYGCGCGTLLLWQECAAELCDAASI